MELCGQPLEMQYPRSAGGVVARVDVSVADGARDEHHGQVLVHLLAEIFWNFSSEAFPDF